MGKKAFTLIELIVVIGLLAIISASGYVTLRNFRHHSLSTAADLLVNNLKYAKNLALTTNIWHGVSFEAETYSVYETDGVVDTLISLVNLPAEYHGTMITSLEINGGSKIEFSPEGIPYTDVFGSALSTTAEVVLGVDSAVVTVKIEAGTGRIFRQ